MDLWLRGMGAATQWAIATRCGYSNGAASLGMRKEPLS